MELVKPSLIINNILPTLEEKTLLSYKEFNSLSPVKVDSLLTLLDDNENVALFCEYVRQKLLLIPIQRYTPLFIPRPDFPSRVLLEMTSRCNLNCTMCPRQNLLRDRIDMKSDLFKKAVDELDKIGINGLWIYNIGESILHPDFPELLRYVSSKNNLGPIWHSSNGQELNEYFSEMIINSKIVFMNMSVNAAKSETYKKISPGGDWEKMRLNFRNFIDLKRKLNKRTPFARLQIIDQEQLTNGEIDEFFGMNVNIADILATNQLEAFSKDVETNIKYAIKRERPTKKSCHRVDRQDLFIFSNGETTFCDTDYNGTFSMGNVKDKSIYEVWNSDYRKKMLELNKKGRLNEVDLCKNCLDFDL